MTQMKKLLMISLLSACASKPVETVNPVVNPPVVVPPPVVVSPQPVVSLESIVNSNSCKDFYFNDYGNSKSKAPLNYIKGLVYTYAQKKCKKETTSESPSQFAEILGLGLWECSGRCCGVDTSSRRPNAISENSAEGGQWQSSYDIKYAVPSIVDFTKNWKGECFLNHFGACTGKEATNHGKPGSDGWNFQDKLKKCPAFGADVVLLNWKHRMTHYWPFKKGIVQKVDACVKLFEQVDKSVTCP